MKDEDGREPITPAASGPTGEGGPAQDAGQGADTSAPSTPDSDSGPGAPAQVGGADAPAGGTPGGTDDMSAFEDQVEDTELNAALSQIDHLGDDLARAKADLYNLNQEYGNYVRRAKESALVHKENGQAEVVESLIGVLDDIEAARAHGDLAEGPFASIATKLEDTLSSRFHVERFGAAGEDFDPQLHEALMAQTSPDVDHPVLAQVLQPGYRMGERVLRATKVLVTNPQ